MNIASMGKDKHLLKETFNKIISLFNQKEKELGLSKKEKKTLKKLKITAKVFRL